jgi:rhamnose transport system substrate-binding protein
MSHAILLFDRSTQPQRLWRGLFLHRARPALVFSAIMPFLFLAGCTPAKPTGPSDSKNTGSSLRMGMMPKLKGIAYFQACERGAKSAAAELRINLLYDGPTDNRVEDQIELVNQWIATGIQAICIAPNDPEAIAPVLKRAKSQGIVVVTFDADANPKTSGRDAFCNQTPTDALAHTMVDIVAEKMGGKGKAIVVSTTPSAPNQNAWMSFMLPRLKEKYPEIVLLETLYPAEDISRARQMTADVLGAHPDLKGIWGLSSVALPGAAEAVKQAKKSGEVAVTGVTLPKDIKEYVKDSTVEKFCLWNPEDLGYLAVQVAHRLKNGSLENGTMDIGRVKGVRVKDGEVILGDPIIFTKENIDQFDF